MSDFRRRLMMGKQKKEELLLSARAWGNQEKTYNIPSGVESFKLILHGVDVGQDSLGVNDIVVNVRGSVAGSILRATFSNEGYTMSYDYNSKLTGFSGKYIPKIEIIFDGSANGEAISGKLRVFAYDSDGSILYEGEIDASSASGIRRLQIYVNGEVPIGIESFDFYKIS